MSADCLHVAVAAIVNDANEVLISLRDKHLHQGGYWEFPGGKIEAGETAEQALQREIKEELNVLICQSVPLISLHHQYPDRQVVLHVYKVTEYRNGSGTCIETDTHNQEGQALAWQPIKALQANLFPAANRSIISALQLDEEYLITGSGRSRKDFLERLQKVIDSGCRLIQLRQSDTMFGQEKVSLDVAFLDSIITLCRTSGVLLMLNLQDEALLDGVSAADKACLGIHLNRHRLQHLYQGNKSGYTGYRYMSASCHNLEEIQQANALSLDFIVLSPVKPTRSHPQANPLGWDKFREMVMSCNLPVFALGGVGLNDLQQAHLNGAQGVAGIRYKWGR